MPSLNFTNLALFTNSFCKRLLGESQLFSFNLNLSASVFIKDNKPSYLLNFIIKFLVQNSKLKE